MGIVGMAVLKKSEQVYTTLRSAIAKGDWRPGEQIPTEIELVRNLGVSRGVVREALNALSREALIERAPGRGTIVAKRLPTWSVAYVARLNRLTCAANHYHVHLLEHAFRHILGSRYRPIVTFGLEGESDHAERLLLESEVMGTLAGVICDWRIGTLEQKLSANGIPVVTIEGAAPLGRYSVTLDLDAMQRHVCEIFRAAGHRDFAVFFAKPPHEPLSTVVRDATYRVLRELVDGDERRLVPVPWTESFVEARECFRDWWNSPRRASAVFFFDDVVAATASWTMLEMGVRIPDDLSILTSSTIRYPLPHPTPFDRLEYDSAHLIESAWTMLESLIRGEEPERHTIRVPPRHRRGASIRPMSGSLPPGTFDGRPADVGRTVEAGV